MTQAYFGERSIRALRKTRRCYGCGKFINTGEQGLRVSGVYDGEFWSGVYHLDCREAEEALNKLNNTYGDEWISLSDGEWEDEKFLREKYPAVALRVYGEPEEEDDE